MVCELVVSAESGCSGFNLLPFALVGTMEEGIPLKTCQPERRRTGNVKDVAISSLWHAGACHAGGLSVYFFLIFLSETCEVTTSIVARTDEDGAYKPEH